MIDMVGIGPFITIPYILGPMGGGRAMLAWLVGGLLAISDGLVTAELSAELPSSGGSYAFLRHAYGRFGRLVSFLFLFQILFSVLLWIGVLGTVAVVIAAGRPHLRLDAFAFWRAPRIDGGHGYDGLGVALIFAVYDYLGYYNICYIGDEVRDPERTIPRVIVISIAAIGAIYLLMNACVISVLPMSVATQSKSVIGDYPEVLLGSPAAQFVTLLILWTAFASIFSLMLGYSRILYAAARDGNFFRIFASLHPRDEYPHVAILFLGVAAALFCLLPLREVVQALVSIRVLIPFIAQVIGAVILRVREPDRPRPFRMWLYPLPAIVALGLWTYVAMSPEKGLKSSGLYVLAAGVVFFVAREALLKRHARAAAKP